MEEGQVLRKSHFNFISLLPSVFRQQEKEREKKISETNVNHELISGGKKNPDNKQKETDKQFLSLSLLTQETKGRALLMSFSIINRGYMLGHPAPGIHGVSQEKRDIHRMANAWEKSSTSRPG